MAEKGAVAVVARPVKQASNVFWDWGVPLVSLGIGYFVGDFFGLGDKLAGFDKNGWIKRTISFVGNPYSLCASFVYFGIALGLWQLIKGGFGKVLGMFVAGIGIRTILRSI